MLLQIVVRGNHVLLVAIKGGEHAFSKGYMNSLCPQEY